MPANERAVTLLAILLILVSLPLVPLDAAPPSSTKRSRTDRDINAIGQREIVPEQIQKIIGSPEKEKERGDAVALQVQHSNKLIQDPSITGYVAGLAENLARNSDAHVPITVMLIDSDEVNACTAPGGYQYLTRGLLLQLDSESELAAVLAHGIAHSALHTPTVQFWRQLRRDLMQPSGGFSAAKSAFMWLTCTSSALSFFSGARSADEFDADYFGAQYLYKSGYDLDGYTRFVQRIWPAPPSANKTVVLALSQFPPASQRSKAWRHEIAEILPLRSEATVSTSTFENFEERLRFWQKTHPAPPAPTQPILRRADQHD
jgi:predicted Zn-dependent protease